MALVMLQLLIRSDVMLPSPAVHTLVHHLVNGASRTRKVAVRAMGMVLRQLKPHHAKKELDLQTQSSLQLSPTLRTLVERAGGRKPANLWLQYNSSLHFCRKEQWEMHPFVHATHVGFYRLPRPFLVYAPEEEQPSLDRTIEDMNAVENE
ncbi:proteasome activator complex subunit 4-like [Haemaphysalis longicornis]